MHKTIFVDWLIFIFYIKSLLKKNEINITKHKILIKHIRNFCIFWKSVIPPSKLSQLTKSRQYDKDLLDECDNLLSIIDEKS